MAHVSGSGTGSVSLAFRYSRRRRVPRRQDATRLPSEDCYEALSGGCRPVPRARLTGESRTQAVVEALRERLGRLRRQSDRATLAVTLPR